MFEIVFDIGNREKLQKAFEESIGSIFKDHFQEISQIILNSIRKQFFSSLGSWVPSGGAVERYPFLASKTNWTEGYLSCFEVILTETNDLTVVVNEEKIQKLGLPTNIVDLLEFGDQFIKPIMHMRSIESVLNAIVDTVSLRVFDHFKSNIHD